MNKILSLSALALSMLMMSLVSYASEMQGNYVCYRINNSGCFYTHKPCTRYNRQMYNSYNSTSEMMAGYRRCLAKHNQY